MVGWCLLLGCGLVIILVNIFKSGNFHQIPGILINVHMRNSMIFGWCLFLPFPEWWNFEKLKRRRVAVMRHRWPVLCNQYMERVKTGKMVLEITNAELKNYESTICLEL